ncbi:glycosyl hydrolase [Noviherbaspirillum soli]|uniref:glycosyl hydrolase n=1 Tax=Noviherbaspirillum soli TaxID=1064518 RepID=UPI00188CD918|nr:glycosyl hydrolase [Noviherbaspirillum soli]
MKKPFFLALASTSAALLLAACSDGSISQADGNASPRIELPRPTPALAGSVAVGSIPLVPLRSPMSASPPSATMLAAAKSSSNDTLGPISTTDPRIVLGSNRALANPWQPGNIDRKLITLPAGTENRMPTGKWFKGLLYQSPLNLDAYFMPNGDDSDPRNKGGETEQSNIFAFPNKLGIDDRMGMVSVSFATRRYIAYGIAGNADVYDLRNPYVADTLLYHIAPNSSQDMRLTYAQPAGGRLSRQVDHFDELTVSTSWRNSTGSQFMQLLAAEGSPYVTMRYAGLRPVVQVGQGSRARTLKDAFGLPLDPVQYAYDQQESDNGIQAVAVGEEPLQTFVENNRQRLTPTLTGTKFRFVYQTPDRARAKPGTNDGNPSIPLLSLKEMVVYSSSPITLEWDTPSRSYVAREAYSGTIRSALVDDVAQEEWGSKVTGISDIPSFKARRAILDRYAATFPIRSEIFLEYDGNATGLIRYRWDTERMDGATARGADLLMMGFDATHIPSLRNPARIDGLTYRSNFGAMSAVAGDEWAQQLGIPGILRNGAEAKQLWMGNGDIKSADLPRVKASLVNDTKLLTTNFLAACNADSYICGKYLHNVSRLALIAENVGDTASRDTLVAYLKQSLALWLDGVDASGRQVNPLTDGVNDTFVYDTTNGGTITSLGLQNYDKDYNNRAYVDHMFHYGYYVYAASVVAALDTDRDKPWLPAHVDKVNLLVRDIANPSLDDMHFPIMRTFDWYRLQNIADTGPDPNGGNTESSSESINANYALATWGAVIKNSPFQAMAAIMTAAEIRTAQAFYQVTPDTPYLKDLDHPEVDVSVKLANGSSTMKIRPGDEPVMNILRANIVETNTFFGPLLANRIGINLLPISPISEFVISPAWARAHSATLRRLEDSNTDLFARIINTPPDQSAACFLAGWDVTKPQLDGNGVPIPPNPGAVCAGRLRVLYSWRQLPVAANGINDPAGAYQRYASYMDALEQQQQTYRNNTRSSVYPNSSLNPEGVVADVLKDNSTPSTDTNTLWWLSSRK